ncbi:MAG: hypothetical protein U1F43_05530 [Myxococcota bacterium]
MTQRHSVVLSLISILGAPLAACGDDRAGVDADALATSDSAVPDSVGGDATTAASDTTSAPDAGQSVLQHHRSATRDGLYVVPGLDRAAAAGVHRDEGFSASIDGPTYAHPLYWDAGAGGQDLVIVATEQASVYALDASTGAVVWQRSLGTPMPLAQLPCGNIDPLGVTGTPVIDPATRTLYVDAMLKVDGAAHHRIFALSLADGATVAGWPVDASSVSSGGVDFDAPVQNQRGALALFAGSLYVPYGGHYGDCGDYHGWVIGVPLADPAHPQAWATRAPGAGAWAPGGVSSDGASIFVSTGNGFGSSSWSDQEAIIRLAPGPSFSQDEHDFWSPSDWKQLDNGDVDLGGSGPVLVTVAGATPSALAVALGKDGKVYLVDRGDMGGVGDAVASKLVASGPIITSAAAYPTAGGADVVFRASGRGCPDGQSGDLVAVAITAGAPPSVSVAWCASQDGTSSPIVTTTDGQAQSIVWTLGSEDSNQLRGFDGDTGAVVFAGGAAGALGAVNRFQSAIVAKGRFYIAGRSSVVAFAIE